MPRRRTFTATLAFLSSLAMLASTQVMGQSRVAITVDVGKTLATWTDRPIGINVNYLKDDDALRPKARHLSDAVAEMGVGWIRYPGGEKSDWHLWSMPPYLEPHPVAYGYYKGQMSDPLDFDEYMALVKATNAQPLVVVGYDSARTGITKDEYLRNAVEWVRYANVVRNYGVKYWEIGNENWHNDTGTPEAVASDVAEISAAMKAVDPTIRTGASGDGDQWWSAYLAADPAIDFFTVSDYPGSVGGWRQYAEADSLDLLGVARSAINALDRLVPADARAGKTVMITEFNSMDWGSGWPNDNNLGHAFMNFETIGQILQEPRISAGMLWTTRWMDWKSADSLFYALDKNNKLLPQGRAVALWGEFLQDRMIETGKNEGLVTFATASAAGDVVNVFLMNKSSQTQSADLSFTGGADYGPGEMFRFQGKSDTDTKPKWVRVAAAAPQANVIEGVKLPALSITVISVQAPQP